MVRKRIHELSREWNVEAKDLVAKLEKLGIHGKRSQSSLTDDEVERLRVEFGADEKPSVTVGDERVLEGIEGETVVERRVRTNVIRRRTTRIEPVPSQETLPQQPSEPLPLATEAFESFAAPESLPEPLPAARSQEAVTITPPPAAPPQNPPPPKPRPRRWCG